MAIEADHQIEIDRANRLRSYARSPYPDGACPLARYIQTRRSGSWNLRHYTRLLAGFCFGGLLGWWLSGLPARFVPGSLVLNLLLFLSIPMGGALRCIEFKASGLLREMILAGQDPLHLWMIVNRVGSFPSLPLTLAIAVGFFSAILQFGFNLVTVAPALYLSVPFLLTLFYRRASYESLDRALSNARWHYGPCWRMLGMLAPTRHTMWHRCAGFLMAALYLGLGGWIFAFPYPSRLSIAFPAFIVLYLTTLWYFGITGMGIEKDRKVFAEKFREWACE